MPDAALHKNSGEMPDRQFVCFPKKEGERRLRVEWVSERRSRINTVLIH